MNEALIKEIIKYKLNIVNSVITYLPPGVSQGVNSLSRIILDTVSEDMKERAKNASKPANKLDNITIE